MEEASPALNAIEQDPLALAEHGACAGAAVGLRHGFHEAAPRASLRCAMRTMSRCRLCGLQSQASYLSQALFAGWGEARAHAVAQCSRLGAARHGGPARTRRDATAAVLSSPVPAWSIAATRRTAGALAGLPAGMAEISAPRSAGCRADRGGAATRPRPECAGAFDAYVWKVAGVASLVIACVGLLISIFSPMASCRCGCPTGALFKLLRYAGDQDRLGGAGQRWHSSSRFGYAGDRGPRTPRSFFSSCGCLVRCRFAWDSSAVHRRPKKLHGEAPPWGANWRVSVIDAPASLSQAAIQARLDDLENIFSNWRLDSAVSRWTNASRSTDFQPVPRAVAEVVLRRHADCP